MSPEPIPAAPGSACGTWSNEAAARRPRLGTRTSAKFAVWGASCALCAVITWGCAPLGQAPPFSHFRAPETSGIRRVVLLPLENQSKFNDVADAFRDELAAEFRAERMFDVIVPSVDQCRKLRRTGTAPAGYDEAVIAAVARRYRADAVIVGQISDYQPYWPPRIGTAVHVVSADQAVPLASVDGHWDARDRGVAAKAVCYYEKTNSKSEQKLSSGELVLHAPRYFRAFVAHEIAHALRPKLKRITVTAATTIESGSSAPQGPHQ